jgi:hypothetical protein
VNARRAVSASSPATDKNKRDFLRKLAVDLCSLAQDISDLITVKQQAFEGDNNRTQIPERSCAASAGLPLLPPSLAVQGLQIGGTGSQALWLLI